MNRAQTEKNGVHVPNKVTTVTKEDAIKKGYCLRKSGEIVINERIETGDIKEERERIKKINNLKQ